MLILDTSVVVACLLRESVASQAESLLRRPDLHEPDILGLEISNALINAVRRERIVPSVVPGLLRVVDNVAMTLHSHRALLPRATQIALIYQRRPYDGLFLALAESLDCSLVTADQKLFNGMLGTPLSPKIRLLGAD